MASPESSSAVPERKLRQWHLEYEAAPKETDPVTLFERLRSRSRHSESPRNPDAEFRGFP
jgi:hypothetical protein